MHLYYICCINADTNFHLPHKQSLISATLDFTSRLDDGRNFYNVHNLLTGEWRHQNHLAPSIRFLSSCINWFSLIWVFSSGMTLYLWMNVFSGKWTQLFCRIHGIYQWMGLPGCWTLNLQCLIPILISRCDVIILLCLHRCVSSQRKNASKWLKCCHVSLCFFISFHTHQQWQVYGQRKPKMSAFLRRGAIMRSSQRLRGHQCERKEEPKCTEGIIQQPENNKNCIAIQL